MIPDSKCYSKTVKKKSKQAPLSRTESQAQTRERLVHAAWDLVARQGLTGASVRDIAEAAGYSQGAFYSNFSSKEDILLELKRRHMAAEAAELEVLLDQARRNPERAMNVVEGWCLNFNQHIDWGKVSLELQLYASSSSAFAKECDQLYRGHRRKLGEVIAGLFNLFNKTPPAPAEDVAESLMALAHGMALFRRPGERDRAGEMIFLHLQALLTERSQTPR